MMTMKTLLTKTGIALVLGVILVALCYYFVDRPVAWFVHDHGQFMRAFWQWPPRVSDWLKNVAPWAVGLAILWWLWKPSGRFRTVLLAIALNLVVTNLLKLFLKWSFGRYWPETWKQNNPSLIANDAYGFHPFHSGSAYQSFPSGHAAVIFSALSIVWLCYPRWRWLCAIVGTAVCVGLVGMNYHFVGDVVAGVLLGSITGTYMTRLFHLQQRPAENGKMCGMGNGSEEGTAK